MGRRSAALACQTRRLTGSHTFDVLAGALDDIHCQYRIRGKVNNRQQLGVFGVFGEQSQSKEAESDQDSSEEPKANYLDTFSILEQDSSLE